MPLNQAGNQSRAEAINDLQRRQAVGSNLTINHALLWEKQVGSPPWIGTDLNDVTACSTVVLNAAHDVNDDSWIITWGTLPLPGGGNERHAYVLTPIETCLWDLNGDDTVDVFDLLILLAKWGSCTDGEFCFADFDCDGAVGVLDVLILLANWGDCGEAPQSVPQTVEDCVETFGEEPLPLERCLCAVQQLVCD